MRVCKGKVKSENQKGNLFGYFNGLGALWISFPGRVGGTLYSSFIDLTDMQFVLVYKLDNQKITRLDLQGEFTKKRKQKIKLL